MECVTTRDVRVYVVNLHRRPDRRTAMARSIPAEWAPVYTSDWDTPRIDGHTIDRSYLEHAGYRLFGWRIASDNVWWSRPLKRGEVGCSLAHLACWQDADTHDEPYTLMLEDDAVLSDDFTDRLLARLTELANARDRFDLLYLGRVPLEPDIPALPGFVYPGYSHCTFGYVLSRTGLDIVLRADLGSAIVPVDEFLPALYRGHPRADVRARFPPLMTALACEPPLVWQRDKAEAGSDTEDSRYV